MFITNEYLVPYLTFIMDNQRLFKVSIKQFNSLNMDEVYGRMFKHIFNPILERFNVPEKERAYVMKFYLTGVFAIVMEWLEKNCSDDMATVIKVITDCVMGAKEMGVIYDMGTYEKGDVKGKSAMTEAYEMGRNS